MYKRIILVAAILSVVNLTCLHATEDVKADSTNTQTEEVFQIAPDDPIVAMLDSLALLSVFTNIEKRDQLPENVNNFPVGFIPEYNDSVYNARFMELNANSTIDFIYNSSVKSFIGLYANRRRELSEKVLGLGQLYFPFFEEQLDKYNLPLELKYLAVIESALNPIARSRAGATGLWQFMYGTGKMYGLQVNSVVDDRSDIYKSTIAACEHFVDLYNIYHDWNLVLCAYNAGPGNVNRAIRRAGGVRDFWAIRNYLPRETRNYVPAFMAVTYVMENAHNHNLFPNPPVFSHFDVDTIQVSQEISLKTVSKFLDIPLDHLRYLNPTFKQSIIPYNEKNPYVLRLPRDFAGVFLANADTIYNHRTPEQLRQELLAAQMQQTTTHVVRRGEVLGSIARRYGTSVRNIQNLNNMRGTLIRPGQRLIVNAPARPATQLASNTNTHVVKRGETLGVIASRYRINVNDIRQWNNISGTTIYPGQNLVVRRPSNATQNEIVKTQSTDEQEGFIYYTVQDGDTLYDIASRYEHISVDDLKELNDFTADANLSPGQKIKISVNDQQPE